MVANYTGPLYEKAIEKTKGSRDGGEIHFTRAEYKCLRAYRQGIQQEPRHPSSRRSRCRKDIDGDIGTPGEILDVWFGRKARPISPKRSAAGQSSVRQYPPRLNLLSQRLASSQSA